MKQPTHKALRITAAVALIGLLGGCTASPPDATPKHDGASPTPSTAKSPPLTRVGSTCEHLTEDEVLRRFADTDDYDDGQHNGRFGVDDCLLLTKVKTPVPGVLRIKIHAQSFWAEPPGDKKALEVELKHAEKWLEIGNTRRLKSCVAHVECRIGEPDCRDTTPKYPGYRGIAAKGFSYPYWFSASVGVWPDDVDELCKADKWSRAQSIRLLKKGLHYLLA